MKSGHRCGDKEKITYYKYERQGIYAKKFKKTDCRGSTFACGDFIYDGRNEDIHIDKDTCEDYFGFRGQEKDGA